MSLNAGMNPDKSQFDSKYNKRNVESAKNNLNKDLQDAYQSRSRRLSTQDGIKKINPSFTQ